ncbi:MAG: hypothetical protein JEY96_11300 [Bacteroidales bacterium]|nr:hypothetical protein [Bacteroidales bacterium]
MRKLFLLIFIVGCIASTNKTCACSILYYVDKNTGKIYVANNEDYWYETKTYIQINPRSENKYARLWYGWDDFAQGGINEAGLFFDGAVTPIQKGPSFYTNPAGNMGDHILATCKTVDEAINYINERNIALPNAHIMFGDSTGNAKIIEWVNGKQQIISIKDNRLVMTNFHLSDTTTGNFPCYRYSAINENLNKLEINSDTLDLLKIGNALGQSAQTPKQNENGKIGGTLYSTFINITDMEFFLVYKLDNTKVTKLDLKAEFDKQKKQKIKLK